MAYFNPSVSQRVHLFFAKTHCPLYRRLSGNVLREICSYLITLTLPAISVIRSTAVVYDLAAGTEVVISLRKRLPRPLISCAIDAFTLICVGCRAGVQIVKRVDLRSGAASDEPPMIEGRSVPGVICFDSSVFVFGGVIADGILRSCEALSLAKREWMQCPNMLYGKSLFTPVEHCKEIYLPAYTLKGQQLEVFSPATRQYRLLPLRLRLFINGSVSFIDNGELLVLTFGRKILAWNLGSQETNPRVVGEFRDDISRVSSGCPVRFENCVYWPDVNGSLVKFDLKSKLVS